MDELESQLSEQQIAKQKNLWKIFGRETKAGKALFSLYKSHEAPKINYPKPKPKSKEELQRQLQSRNASKKCPQKTQIQYPEPPRKEQPGIYPVDLIPRRKNEAVIRQEIEKFYSKVEVPANRGVDRKKLIESLQKKFKNERGALPKQAELPRVDMKEEDFDEELIRKRAEMRVDRKHKTFTQKVTVSVTQPKESEPTKTAKQQLNDLFDEVVKEIEERQRFLDSIEELDEPELKARIKNEMIERVSELQKIGQIRKQMK